jgi:hypothetical protein
MYATASVLRELTSLLLKKAPHAHACGRSQIEETSEIKWTLHACPYKRAVLTGVVYMSLYVCVSRQRSGNTPASWPRSKRPAVENRPPWSGAAWRDQTAETGGLRHLRFSPALARTGWRRRKIRSGLRSATIDTYVLDDVRPKEAPSIDRSISVCPVPFPSFQSSFNETKTHARVDAHQIQLPRSFSIHRFFSHLLAQAFFFKQK